MVKFIDLQGRVPITIDDSRLHGHRHLILHQAIPACQWTIWGRFPTIFGLDQSANRGTLQINEDMSLPNYATDVCSRHLVKEVQALNVLETGFCSI